MSGVTGVDPIALDNAPRRHATIPLPEEPSDQPETTGGNADEPAVVVSLSIAATTAMQDSAAMLALDPDEVDHALSWVVGVNGFAATAARTTTANVAADGDHWNEADAAAAYGASIAEPDTAKVIGAAVGSPSEALYHAANLGIPILCSVNLDAAGHDASSRTTGVGAFTFTHGGSTYAIVPVADDLLIGTRDGEVWKTWQRANPGDAPDAGMATAAGFQAPAPLATEPEMPADGPLSRIDVSA
jgi:hypothetical protein